jgi:uncharacterized protein (TIGR03435 family)
LSPVYVVRAESGEPPAPLPQSADSLGFAGFSFSRVEVQVPESTHSSHDLSHGVKPVGPADIRAISLEGTMDDFCHTIERALDRPVVNETNLAGVYTFDIKAGETSENNFLERLRDQLSLNIIPGERRVQVVAVKPR